MIRNNMTYILLLLGLCCSLTANAGVMDSLLRDKNDPVVGNPHGEVTIVEFFDYQCSHCMSMAKTIATLLKANPDIRIVFKEYPVTNKLSVYASRMALAANKQGKYYDFSHALLTTHLPVNKENILKIAKSSGLNPDKLQKDMYSSAITKQIQANYTLARTLNIYGTPTFIISKTNATNSQSLHVVMGEMSLRELQRAISKA